MKVKRNQWNVICDRCGFRYKNWQLKKEWTGFMVCSGSGTNQCWEPRHPQDFLRARKENNSLPWTRPEQTDVSAYNISWASSTVGTQVHGEFGQASYGTADFAIVGNININLVP